MKRKGKRRNVKCERCCTTLGPVGIAGLKNRNCVFVQLVRLSCYQPVFWKNEGALFVAGATQLSPSWFKLLYNLCEVLKET